MAMSKVFRSNITLLVLGGIGMIVGFAYLAFTWGGTPKENYSDVIVNKPAILAVQYADGRKRAFEGYVLEGMTVLDVLSQAAAAGDFQIDVREGEEEALSVESVDGVGSGGGESWRVYRNGADVDGRIASEQVKPGDKLEMRYE